MTATELDIHRSGQGEPLLLLHGIGSTWRMWRPVLPMLEREFDVLAIDFPGFGRSQPFPPGTPSNPETLANAAERAMDEAGFDTAHIAGNSMGGRIAAELARRGRARTAVLSSPAGLATEREKRFAETQLKMAIAMARKTPRHILEQPWARYGATFTYARPGQVDPAFYVEQVEMLAGSADFEETLKNLHATQPPGLETITTPTLIAWGTKDRLLLPRQAERWGRILPNAEVRYLEGLGHVPVTDDPELVAETIRRWTRQPAAAPA